MAFPSCITQGDSATWTFPAADASEAMTYAIRSADGDGITIRGINDATDHTFTLNQAASSMLPIGMLIVSRITEDGAGARTTKPNIGTLTVRPDTMSDPEQTYNARMVSGLESALAERVKGGLIETRTLGGLSVGKMGTAELQSLLKEYRVKLMREKEAGRAARGQGGNSDYLVSF